MRLTALLPLSLLTLSACGPHAVNTDIIRPTSMIGNDSPTVVLIGRRSTCMPYEVTSGTPDANVDNVLTPNTCPSEVAVFARGNGMSLVSGTERFTDASGDVVSVPMTGPLNVPLKIFLMSGALVTHSVTDRQNDATDNVTAATELFDNNRCGVTFSSQIKDATLGTFTPDLLTASCLGNVARFKAVDPAVSANAINVFYVDGDPDVLGETCADGNSAVIRISAWAGDEILAHELGHALSLDHANGITNMPADNLMMSPTAFPATMSAGQCFRVNVDTQSVLNKLSIRTGAKRPCPVSGTACPPLDIHK
jgi:hypothetical protein